MSPTLPHGLLQAGRGPRWRADDGVTRPAPWRSGAPATDGRPGRPAWSDPPPVPRSRPPLDTGNPASTRPLWPAPGRPGHAHSVTAHQPAADIEHVGMTAPTDPLTTGPRPSTSTSTSTPEPATSAPISPRSLSAATPLRPRRGKAPRATSRSSTWPWPRSPARTFGAAPSPRTCPSGSTVRVRAVPDRVRSAHGQRHRCRLGLLRTSSDCCGGNWQERGDSRSVACDGCEAL